MLSIQSTEICKKVFFGSQIQKARDPLFPETPNFKIDSYLDGQKTSEHIVENGIKIDLIEAEI